MIFNLKTNLYYNLSNEDFRSLTWGLSGTVSRKKKGAGINVIAKYVYAKHSLLLI